MASDAKVLRVRRQSSQALLPWSLGFLVLLLGGVAIALTLLNRPVTQETLESLISDSLSDLNAVAAGLVGAVILWKRPGNRIGWLGLSAGLLSALQSAASGYAIYALVGHTNPLAFGILAEWLSQWIFPLPLMLLTLLVLWYPTGQFLSPRWRIAAWAAVAVSAVMVLFLALDQSLFVGTGPDTALARVDNPIGLVNPYVVWPIITAGFTLSTILTVIGIVSLLIRFRHSTGQERQQIKWITYAIAILALFQLPSPFIPGIWFQVLDNAASLLIPIAIGIAILRYRLYDIDLLINRTLVYLPLTGILAGIFAASIALTQKLFLLATGASSEAATVLTTLIVVAAFEPLKTALQHLVDRRFKEAPDPARRVKAFDQQVRSFIEVADAEEISRRLLDETQAAFDASGGALFRTTDGTLELVRTAGQWDGQVKVSVPLLIPETNSRIGELALGPRKNGLDYTSQDREILERTAQDVARAMRLDGRHAIRSGADGSRTE